MRTGTYQAEDPYPPLPPPPVRPTSLWTGSTQRVSTGQEYYELIWNAVLVRKQPEQPPKEVVQLWSIRDIVVRAGVYKYAAGLGDVALSIAYTGYYGPGTIVLRSVPEPDLVKAIIRRQIGTAAAYP